MANKFKVGDRVVGIMNHMDAVIKDKLGTVRTVEPTWIGVEFDEEVYSESGIVYGHNLNGSVKEGYGYFVYPSEIAKVEEKEPKRPDYEEILKGLEEGLRYFLDLDDSKKPTSPTVSGSITLPKLSSTDRIKCAIICDTHPYAVLDSDGRLWFYAKRPETLSYFETAAVTPP